MTLKYKAKDRYALGGWTDPRMPQLGKTGFEDVATEVLRSLWLVKFGGRAETMDVVHALRDEDIGKVGLELARRKQLREEAHSRFDSTEVTYYYVLEREDGNH